ncbi:MAG: BBP7 family outer membrane beta-barrel protein [Pirellulaceae bacterium]
MAFPGVIGGSIAVDATSPLMVLQFASAVKCAAGRLWIFRISAAKPFDRFAASIPRRLSLLGIEGIVANARALTSQLTTDPGSFDIIDRFTTLATCSTVLNWECCGKGRTPGWWSLDMLMRLGIGNNLQNVTINGSTATTVNGTTTNGTGGLLAQRTNIGTYERNQFTMVPELGARGLSGYSTPTSHYGLFAGLHGQCSPTRRSS